MSISKEDIEGDDKMTPPVIERYCTVEESVKESLKEVKLMREGKIPKLNWRDSFAKLREELEEDL